MCVTCGCSDDANVTVTNPQTGEHTHVLADGTVVSHSHHHEHSHEHHHEHPHTHSVATENAQLHAKMHGTTVSLEQNILAKNDLLAAQNRGWFKGRNILALNLVSSPGSGKTTLLARTIEDLKDKVGISVIEGDQATTNDADRIKATGCPVIQINTGTGCHLDANMVERGLQELNPPLNSIVMIENVGNLVCPALFDLGETAKVAILSVTEGEDKPIKYPYMFRASQVMIINKIDLLPYVQFNVDRCIEYARQVNPHLQVFQVSATTGTGLDAWYRWLGV
ncbi:hydrogenase nickel incorporation protein HypB [Planktothrix sp. FACHB-1355]|uniref:Hydrogenase nickel incorporation protein HypB n=1 Tax=Aerosakkonema funiforme FACHB-1375 TaxID=2949571 RepID=A0A926ZIQ2_9CYAN|nr:MULTISPECIES: hydrogenase nickel incorporation protein HypB [Oscillatoriales]MBD2183532.1 hydrogenase nickel incorporation protein HypB [Aerosakkonema funiforme FACHB-1375]MBD3558439.1 hydrogenase nickel incorporation protein HypB [Planktothrix sp. FACHB-1355]